MDTYGIELLDEGNWTVERLGQALAGDLARAQTEEGGSDPMLQSSLAGVLEIWSQQILASILEGRFDTLGVFAREISVVFARCPKLPLGRSLNPLDRAGAHLELLLSQIHCVQALPARTRVDALFAPETKGHDLRSRIIQFLYDERDGLSTPTLMERTGASRQTLHLALQKLREHGLVVSDPLGPSHHHTLNPAGRQMWERIQARTERQSPVAAALIAGVVGVATGAVGMAVLKDHAGAGESRSPEPATAARTRKRAAHQESQRPVTV